MVSHADADDDAERLLQRPSHEKERTPRPSLVFDGEDGLQEKLYDNGAPESPHDPRSPKEKRPALRLRTESATRRDKSFFREMTFQTVPMLFLALIGSVLAGEVLARLKFWPAFIRVEELFILIPILLNLKGNIEMNLSSRFSTSANIGELDIRLTRQTLVIGNLALLQVQTLICSFIAGIIAFLLGIASRIGLSEASAVGEARGTYFECLTVLCASMLAASLSSAIIGSFMCSLVIVSRRFRINPDNIATPLAASLGDLLTLTLLGNISSFFVRFMGTLVSTFVFLALVCAIAFHIIVTFRNAYVQELLWSGWIPLFVALFISSGTGLVLQKFVNEFQGFGLLASVVTGIAGNVGAIFVSRISTALHATRQEHYFRTASTLYVIAAPVLCLFLLFAWATDQLVVGPGFALLYCLVICTIIPVTLTIGWFLAVTLWKFDYDPDINALPLLTSITDCCGQLLLAGAFALTHRVLATPTLQDVLPSAPSATFASSTVAALASASASLR